MNISIYQVDAFTNKMFSGNPAAVCPLKDWLDDETLQNIAAENNLSETAFFVKKDNYYEIRWMTPTTEVPLCGHATLASSYIIFKYIETGINEIVFQSKSGKLIVTRADNLITLNFPANRPTQIDPPNELLAVVNIKPIEVLFNKSYLAIFDSEEQIINMLPNIPLLKEISGDGLIISARGNAVDFVSRYFVPSAGIDEDPVTGFAHTILIPYWAEKLNKSSLHALQVSKRGGELFCEDLGDRVKISGSAVEYMSGKINI